MFRGGLSENHRKDEVINKGAPSGFIISVVMNALTFTLACILEVFNV